MVLAFIEGGESEHLVAIIRFIKANHLDDELRAHNLAAFARCYNGPKYAEDGYNTRLAASFARWAKIPDTPWPPAQDAVGKPVPVPPVETKPLPTPPVFAPAPRDSGTVAPPTIAATAPAIHPQAPPSSPPRSRPRAHLASRAVTDRVESSGVFAATGL